MGIIYFVRHGQASLGAQNYDQLSDLGFAQAEQLGLYFLQQKIQFEAVYTGTLQRQKQTLSALAQSAQQTQWLEIAAEHSGLNEYDSESVIKAVNNGSLDLPQNSDTYKNYFLLLRKGIQAWINNEVQPENLPSFEVFKNNIISVMHHIQNNHTGNVLVVSSGGPISITMAHLLGCNPSGAIELNLRLRNSAISEVHYHPKKLSVISFNTLPHLANCPQEQWWTYA